MTKFNYTIQDPVGMHARPAGTLVKYVSELTSTVMIEKGDKSVDAKRLFGIMGLAIKNGEEVTFALEGENEVAEAAALEAFCKESF